MFFFSKRKKKNKNKRKEKAKQNTRWQMHAGADVYKRRHGRSLSLRRLAVLASQTQQQSPQAQGSAENLSASLRARCRRRGRPPWSTWQPSRPSPGGLPRHWRRLLRASSPSPPPIRTPKPYRSCCRRRRRLRGTLSFLPGARLSSTSSAATPTSSPRWIAAAAVPSWR